tara:strand:- start:1518 stop:2321 length:804 start_codon:yes stop_codon:yes gene_type:complete
MKISIFTTMTNPEERMDPWKESLACYEDFADEVIVVGENFKNEFTWSDIGKMFTEGLNRSTGDWVLWMDIDNLFHEKDIDSLRNGLEKFSHSPSIALPKIQIFTPERFSVKSVICRAFNKRDYPEIKLNGGGDLCLPTLNGKLIKPEDVPKIKVPIWNYDTVFRTKEVISQDRARFARAWYREFGNYGERGGEEPNQAYQAWYSMVEKRYKSHTLKLKINEHPKYIKDKINNLGEDQFGYNGFGLQNNQNIPLMNYLRGYKDKIKYL